MCLVRSWKTGFLAIYIAAKLSHLTEMGVMEVMVNSARSRLSQASSTVIRLRFRYSTSTEDMDTVTCFLDFQEINVLLRKITKPLTDLRVWEHAAQSASQ